MDCIFMPQPNPLHGVLRVPGDKSISHRAVLFSAMAEGTSNLSGVLDSDDVRSSIAIVSQLGAKTDLKRDETGCFSGTITGWGVAGPQSPDSALDCGNSGTTTRLLLGLLTGYNVIATLFGDESLTRRPMRRVIEPLTEMGARFFPEGVATLPITITGRSTPCAIEYVSPVASAQVKTAVLLAGLHADGTTSVTEPALSRDHTERLLPAYGVSVRRDGLTVSITGGLQLHAVDLDVPGDPSSAAFLAVAAALIEGSDLRITDVSLNETRTGFLKVMNRMGADIVLEDVREMGSEPIGTVHIRYKSGLTGCVVEPHEIPSLIDEVPALALLATGAAGPTRFCEVGELRVKESDRLAAIVEGLCALGCKARVEGDDLIVESGRPSATVSLSAQGDHRLAMTWALAGLVGEAKVTVKGFECVSVSYPRFSEDLASVSNHHKWLSDSPR